MPVFTKPPAALVATFGEAIQSVVGVQTRKMFGYPAAFLNGHMFACLFRDAMIVRLSELDRSTLAKAGAKLFEPMPGRPMREYLAVPPAVLAKPAELRTWLSKSAMYVSAMPPKASARKK